MKIVLVLAVLTISSIAHAGSANIKDNAGLFSKADVDFMTKSADKSAFSVHVLTETSAFTLPEFERLVAAQVTTSDVLAIGIEKAHRHFVVKPGGSTGVPAGNGRMIGEAGVPFLKQGNFGAAVDAMIVKATQVRVAAPLVLDVPTSRGVTPVVLQTTAATAPPIHEGPGFLFWLAVVVLAAAAIGYFVHRKRKLDSTLREAESERDELRADRVINEDVNSIGERPFPSSWQREKAVEMTFKEARRQKAAQGVVQRSAPIVEHHVHHDSGSGGDLLTGVLIGNALADRHDHHREVVREVERPEPSYSRMPSSSRDSGSYESSSPSSDSGSWGDSSSSDSGSSGGGDSGGGDSGSW